MSEATTQAAGNAPTTGSTQTEAGAAPAGAPAAPAAPPAGTAPASQPQQAAAGQTTGGKPDGSTQTTGAPAQPGAPEKYEFKAPQGVQLDADVMAEYASVAKELNLPADAAQKVLDKLAPKLAVSNATALGNAMKATVNGWAKASEVDPEFGGEKLKENLAVAAKAVERYAPPELRSLLQAYDPVKNPKGTGLGNHPEVIRMFVRIGKAISEDKLVTGGTDPGKGARDAATVLYGSSSTKA